MLPLCPPKPRLFEIDGAGVQGRADPTTRSIANSGSTTVVPAVGGIKFVLHCQQHGDGFERARCTEGMTSDTFGRCHRHASWAEDLGDRCGLGGIVERRRGPVGVYVADVAGLESGVGERKAHAGDRTDTTRRRRGDVMRIGVATCAEYLADDGGPTALRGRPLFEYQHARRLRRARSRLVRRRTGGSNPTSTARSCCRSWRRRSCTRRIRRHR